MGNRLESRHAVITGGGSGIGRATAVLFAAEGASVTVVDQDADGAAATVGQITAAGGSADHVVGDVADEELAASTVAECVSRRGTLDALVTAAGISVGHTVVNTSREDWDRVFEVNVTGTFLWMKAALPVMIEQRRGSIIAVASQLAVSGGLSNAAYIASKGAVLSLVRTAANDHARQGVRINCVVPGATRTPLFDRSFARLADPGKAMERSLSRHPMGRFGEPEEVAAAALFLAGDESSFTTGTELRIDGGWIGG